MITNFKLFESRSSILPNKGDYVFYRNNTFKDKNIENYCNTHIGKIIDIRNRNGKGMLPTKYTIEYDLPLELAVSTTGGLKIHSYIFLFSDIEYWSKNLEKVELYMKSKKYNI